MLKILEYLNITIDEYALNLYLNAIDMDNVDIVLGYPWMDSVGTININM